MSKAAEILSKVSEGTIEFTDLPDDIKKGLTSIGFDGDDDDIVYTEQSGVYAVAVGEGVLDAKDVKVVAGMKKLRSITAGDNPGTLRITFKK